MECPWGFLFSLKRGESPGWWQMDVTTAAHSAPTMLAEPQKTQDHREARTPPFRSFHLILPLETRTLAWLVERPCS